MSFETDGIQLRICPNEENLFAELAAHQQREIIPRFLSEAEPIKEGRRSAAAECRAHESLHLNIDRNTALGDICS